MKKVVLLLVILSVLLAGCIKLGSAAPAGNVPGKASDAKGGMAQNPEALQSLPFGQPANPGGLQEGGQSGSAPLNQFGSTSNAPSSPGSSMGELQGLQEGGVGGGDQGGELPALQGGGKSGTLGGFNPPPAPVLPAGVPVEKLPFFEKDLYADTYIAEVGEPVFLGWKLFRADSFSLALDNGAVIPVPGDRTGTFVVNNVPGSYAYVLTAKNAYGSVSQKVQVPALSKDQRPAYVGDPRCRTFAVYPQQIKKGQSVFVYWNVMDAQRIYLENSLMNSMIGSPDPRDEVTASGTEEFWPVENTIFRLTFHDGKFPDTRTSIRPDYGWREVFVDVR